MIDASTVGAYVVANLAMAAGAAAQASIGMGLNMFAVPILALIDPVYVPGPVLVHSFLVASAASYRLRSDINWRELGVAAHAVVRHPDLFVPKGAHDAARAILVEAWGEERVAELEPAAE